MFKDKVALVTGSSRGIGKATIIELVKKGCHVVINYNEDKENAIELEKYIKNGGRSFMYSSRYFK